MEKDRYIKLISDFSDKYGDKLLQLLDKCHKNSLKEVTLDELKEFYTKIIGGKEDV